MTPTERRRRIADANRRRLAVIAERRVITDEVCAEVEAAHNDPEARLPYREAARVMGVKWQSLADMLKTWRERQAEAQADTG